MRAKPFLSPILATLRGSLLATTLLGGALVFAQGGSQGSPYGGQNGQNSFGGGPSIGPTGGCNGGGDFGGGGGQIDACSGYYYDPGGASGDYGNDEHVTLTICPAGGPGSGPATSVLFLEWNVEGVIVLTDQLRIYDGTSVSGLPIAIGSNLFSLAGQSFTSTDPSGCLTFDWQSDLVGTAAGWVARITTALHAGDNTSANVCSSSAPLSLFSLLSGNPDPGGSWKDPGGAPHSDTFDAAVDLQGNWNYSHSVPATCPPSSATLTITKILAADPGQDAVLTLCSTDAPVSLFNALGGTPDPGGIWTGPNSLPHSGTFDPGSDVPGVYTYTVTGTLPCLTESATVTVTVNDPPNAGTDGTITVCSNGAPFSLFAQLGGSPDATGAWSGPGATPVSGTYSPGTSTPGIYTYTVPGDPPCADDISTVTVTQVAAPNAGSNRSITVCSDDASFSMLAQLSGSPAAGGTWAGPGGAHGNSFDPATDAAGAYTYTVTGTPPCANASAVLTITINAAPDAGTNGSVTLCSNNGVYALFNALGGSPDVGGSWRDPSNAAHSGNFTPGSSAPGVYTYTVAGLAPCDPASATVTVAVNTAPNAGTGSNVTRCSNAANFGLFNQLGGSPAAGGTWRDPNNVIHSNTFDPGVDLPGPYTYTVAGTAPCANATAVVNVTIVNAPRAGSNGSRTVCSNAAPFSLFAQLGGTPDANGSWTGPGGGSVSVTFTPGTSTPGVYTYTVVGTAPCTNATATVTVVVVNAPNPGTNGSISLCSNAASVNLFTLLGGNPQSGGTWTKPGGGSHSGIYQPATDPGGNYTYTVNGTSPCTNLSAIVQVTRTIAPNAGTNGSITVCNTNGPFSLIGQLGGSPNGTGNWLDPSLAPASGTFTPGTSAAGIYAYIVAGTAPCVSDTGFVTVTVNIAPNAGTNASITVCDNASPFQLFSQLGGTPMSGGSWTRPDGTPHSGTFTPGVSQTGGYTYSVAGSSPCVNATAVVTVSVNHQPNAGNNDSFTRCSTDSPVNLLNELGGTPESGGTWTGPGGPMNGTFTPGTSLAGVYTYTITASAPCVNASATVTATINQAPNAGGDGDITVCQGNGSVDLFTGITGPYDTGGDWDDLDNTGQLNGSIFNYTGLPPGHYDFDYDVQGIGQCGADHADVDVDIVPQLNAGNNSSSSACSSSTQVNLFNLIGGSPQAGGTWIDLDNTGDVTGQFFNANASGAGVYHFRYMLTGTIGCDSDSADVTLTVVAAPNAGTNASTTVCSNSGSFSMFNLLGGSPQGGGQWHVGSPGGPNHGVMYDPSSDSPNTFYYVVGGSAPCSSTNSTVTVSEVQAPFAGNDASISVCSNGAAFNLFNLLTGNPNPGGSWFFNNVAHTSTYDPSLDIGGLYEYRVSGQPPCSQDVAVVNVTEQPAANAGCPSSVTVCENSPAFQLFNVLTCSPSPGGTWLGPNLLPHSATYNPPTDDPGDYYYIVVGTSPCVNDTSVVSVFEIEQPYAGCDAIASYCASATNPGPIVDLFTLLTCNPDPFGTWVGPAPGNPSFDGFFQPGISTPGVYTYTVSNSCGSDNAQVSVSVSAPPNAGCNGNATLCSNGGSVNMFSYLGCNPTAGGQWSGPLPSTAIVSNFFQPGVSTPGIYRYKVTGTGACSDAFAYVTVTVNQQANAGTGGGFQRCRTAGTLDLFTLLTGNPQTGGTWFFNGDTISQILGLDTASTGTYTYVVNGVSPCTNSQASVVLGLYAQPYAGDDGLLEICSDGDPVSLINYLTGAQFGGTWTGPNGPHSGIYDPAIDGSGLYSYTVAANAGCPGDVAYVTVFEYNAVFAGNDATVQVCANASAFQLFALLTGGAQSGGTWYDPDGNVFNGTYIPGTSQPGEYDYELTGTPPCASDLATVTVIESTEADAGIGSLAPICSSIDSVPLISLLNGTPDATGSWTQGGQGHDPYFNPTTDLPGSYVYTVVGTPPCPNATAQVTITVTQAVSAGTDGSITACAGADAVALFDGLEGDPDPGGTWVNNCGQGSLSNGIYDASSLSSGDGCNFTYTQAANGPCPATSANVILSIVNDLDAGTDSSSQACFGQTVQLFNVLGGNWQPGGYWVNVNGAPGLTGSTWFTGSSTVGNTYHFDYVLPGSAQCESDTARVSIGLLDGPFAGIDGNLNICSISTANMFSALGGNPDSGGSWFNPDWTPRPGPNPQTFVPASNPPGIYHYVVGGVGACPADTANVTMLVTAAANAGTDAPLVICSDGDPVDMFLLLGANAQAGGTWIYVTGGNVPHNNIYNPVIDSPIIYRYAVPGTGPCPTDYAFITVTEHPAPNAGVDDNIAICSSDDNFDMRPLLGPSAQNGGTWIHVTGGNTPHGAFFNPEVDLPGLYQYIVVGTPPCGSDTAGLTIDVVPARYPGVNTTVDACVDQTSVNIFLALGAGAETGGTWSPSSPALIGDIFNPSVAGNGTWPFTYTLLGNGPCQNESAIITVEVGSGSSAGTDSIVSVCGNTTAYDLFNALGGSPTAGGTWTDLVGTGATLVNGVLTVSDLPIGGPYCFGYTVVDAGCGNVSATVCLTATAFPVAGTGTTITLCSNGTEIDLFAQLTGVPHPTGTWTDPSNQPHGATFDPATDPEGAYTYTVTGVAPCADATATVVITVNDPPNAGTNGTILACDTLVALELFTGLQGTPQTGGAWTDLEGTGGLAGGSLNTTGIAPGDFDYRYTVTVAGCGDASAIVTVTVVTSVEVMDMVRTCNETDRTYIVSFTLQSGDSTTYEVTGLAGTMTTISPFIFTSEPIFTSQDFEAFVQDQYACSVLHITGETPCDFDNEVFVPETFSPNGDGVNDLFLIPGIEGYPDNVITIFNRWGAKMYDAAGYDNRIVVWDGTSLDAAISGPAPAGTYYYVLELGDGIEAITGFIYLNR